MSAEEAWQEVERQVPSWRDLERDLLRAEPRRLRVTAGRRRAALSRRMGHLARRRPRLCPGRALGRRAGGDPDQRSSLAQSRRRPEHHRQDDSRRRHVGDGNRRHAPTAAIRRCRRGRLAGVPGRRAVRRIAAAGVAHRHRPSEAGRQHRASARILRSSRRSSPSVIPTRIAGSASTSSP